jgi:hypothetical protein
MDFWTAAVAIVSIVMIAEIIKAQSKTGGSKKHKSEQDAKMADLERRIQSLETIVIDLDKEKRFRDLR